MTSDLLSVHGVSLRIVVRQFWEELRSNDVLGRSAQLAYYFFLALFPFLICIVASLSVLGRADRGRILLFELLARFLPPPAFQLISSTFDEILRAGGPLKMSLGVIVSLWSASMGMTAVVGTLNAAYKVKETRSLLKQYGVAIGLTIAITLLLVGSIVAVLVGHRFAAESIFGKTGLVIWKMAPWLIGCLVLLLTFDVIYYYGPNLNNRKWHWITPGTVAGIALLILVSIGLRVYLHYAGTYTLTYGSLGGVIILLLSFYLSGIALLSGGVLNAILEGLTSQATCPRYRGTLDKDQPSR